MRGGLLSSSPPFEMWYWHVSTLTIYVEQGVNGGKIRVLTRNIHLLVSRLNVCSKYVRVCFLTAVVESMQVVI